MGKKSNKSRKSIKSTVEEREISTMSNTRAKLNAKQSHLQMLYEQLANSVLKEMDKSALINRLSFVDEIYSDFTRLEDDCFDTGESDIAIEILSKFMPLYFDVKDKLSREINLRNQQEFPRTSTQRQFSLNETPIAVEMVQRSKIPELQSPKFYGSYTDWPDFISLFNSLINKSPDLSKLEKFQHLRSNLKGAALDIIRSLELKEENYDKALELLTKRFDNKLLIFQAHIKEIFGLHDVEKGSAAGMRDLSDKINVHMNALQTLGTKEDIADGMLIHVIYNKLDSSSKAKWEDLLPNNELPPWSTMASFLERRSRTLEKLASDTQSTTQAIKKGNVHVASTRVSKCVFCDSNEYWISTCQLFSNLSPSLRYKEAKKLQLCLNCLRKGHTMQVCKSGSCRHCKLKHNSLLHMGNISSKPIRTQVSPSSANAISPMPAACISTSPSQTSSNNQSFAPENFTLLASAIILIKDRFGSFVPYRALLDSASQINFVTTRLVKQLKL